MNTDFLTRINPFLWTFNVGLFANMAFNNFWAGRVGLGFVDLGLAVLCGFNARLNLKARDRLVRDAE